MKHLLRSMPFRLTLGLVLLFSFVSLLTLGATYAYTWQSLDQAMQEDLNRDMAGYRAAPSASALGALVQAQAAETDPERMVLSYFAPNLRHFGNAVVARDVDGYHVVSVESDGLPITGSYQAFTATLYGGQLTIARSRAEIDGLARVFRNILFVSLLPTVLIALFSGLYLARRSARQVTALGKTLDQITSGDLSARLGPVPGWTEDLARIAGKIDQMAQSQESSVAAIRQVSSDIAHDLKTPIQRVAVHLDELAAHPDLSADDLDLVERARAELAGVVAVFQSLLQIAQIKAGTPRSGFTAVDAVHVVRTCIELYEPTAAETGYHLRGDFAAHPVPPILGDKNLLMQMVANLIENALHHTPIGSEIILGVTAGDKKVVISVTDNGPGIPEEERSNVLRRLYRLDRSRTTPGSGLGLNFVSVVAALHGGELVLGDNAPGLAVRVVFPVQLSH
jgi:signal transduction histidine kinase